MTCKRLKGKKFGSNPSRFSMFALVWPFSHPTCSTSCQKCHPNKPLLNEVLIAQNRSVKYKIAQNPLFNLNACADLRKVASNKKKCKKTKALKIYNLFLNRCDKIQLSVIFTNCIDLHFWYLFVMSTEKYKRIAGKSATVQ